MKITVTAFCATLIIASIAELSAQNEERQRPNREGRERPDVFALSDKDKNGEVTLDELVNSRIEMMSRMAQRGGGDRQRPEGAPERRDPEEMKARLKENMAEAFAKADKDENGSLTREEFEAMPQMGRGPGGPRGGPRPEGGQRPNRGDRDNA